MGRLDDVDKWLFGEPPPLEFCTGMSAPCIPFTLKCERHDKCYGELESSVKLEWGGTVPVVSQAQKDIRDQAYALGWKWVRSWGFDAEMLLCPNCVDSEHRHRLSLESQYLKNMEKLNK